MRRVRLVLFPIFAGSVVVAPGLSAQAGAVLVGAVLADSSRAPLEGAEISIAAVSKRALAGTGGRFRIDGIPAGTWEVTVRYVGFSPHATQIAFAAADSVQRDVLLRSVAKLEPVNVQAASVIPSFEENRAVGLGTFITRAELEKQHGRKLSDILTQVRGVRVLPGTGGRAWVFSSRRPVTSINAGGTRRSGQLDAADTAAGARPGLCYPQVYQDQRLVYRGDPEEPLFDVNSVHPSEIEAIEFYAGPASTPHRYSRLNSNCGVLVIHTRRTP